MVCFGEEVLVIVECFEFISILSSIKDLGAIIYEMGRVNDTSKDLSHHYHLVNLMIKLPDPAYRSS